MANSENDQALVRRPTDDVLEVIRRAASDPNVDIAKMQALLEMQERVMRQRAEIEFNEALQRVQEQTPRIVKGREIIVKGQLRSRYAALEDIDDVMRPILLREGFSTSYDTTPAGKDGKDTTIILTVKHRLGHKSTHSLTLPFDRSEFRSDVQSAASTVSFGKRQLFCMAFNVITVGVDFDGAKNIEAIDERQVNTILDMIAAAEMSPESQSKFLAFMSVKALGDIRRCDYDKAITALRTKVRQHQGGR
jgi:hypothetical protein